MTDAGCVGWSKFKGLISFYRVGGGGGGGGGGRGERLC